MKKNRTLLLLLLCALLATACRDDDFVAPSFLHVDAIKLVPPTQNAITMEPGFYTSDIVGAYVVAHYPDAMSVDTLGLFTLPFTVPLLHDGPVDYFEFYPAIVQSGQVLAMPFYTFYNRIRISDTTVSSGDTLRLDTLATTYNITRNDVLMYEMFEPTEGSLLFDSAMLWRPHSPEEACSGYGYGYVPVVDTVPSVSFSIDRDFYVTDATKLLYLEMDVQTDVEFEVYMVSSVLSGSNTTRMSVMRVYKNDKWTHLYINLGRTWAYFNYNPQFRITFSTLNLNGIEGELRMDNVRLLTTNVVL